MVKRVLLVLIEIRRSRPVGERLRQRPAQSEKCELTRPIDQGSQLDRQRTVVHHLEDDGPTPTWLDPGRGLMHAQADSRVGTPPFDQRDQIVGHANLLVRHRQHELARLEGERDALTEFVPFGKANRVSETRGRKGPESAGNRQLHARELLQPREAEAETQIDGCLSPLVVLKCRLEDHPAPLHRTPKVGLGKDHPRGVLCSMFGDSLQGRSLNGRDPGTGEEGAGEFHLDDVAADPGYLTANGSAWPRLAADIFGPDESRHHAFDGLDGHEPFVGKSPCLHVARDIHDLPGSILRHLHLPPCNVAGRTSHPG